MKFTDLLEMCLQNLKRQKSRTLLTMTGVMVGVASITVMVSLGFGISEQSDKMIESMGDLTMITVYGNGTYFNDGQSQDALNDESIYAFQSLEHVSAVTPKISFNFPVTLSAGTNDRYQAQWANITALDFSALEAAGYTLMEGDLPQHPEGINKKIPVLVGRYLEYNFMDTLRPEGSNMIFYTENDEDSFMGSTSDMDMGITENEDPYFDALKTPMNLSITNEDGTNSEHFTLEAGGRLKNDWSRGYETVEGMLIDLSAYKEIKKQYNLLNGIRSRKEDPYEEVIVKVDHVDQVDEVEKAIQNMGYSTYSMNTVRESMNESNRFAQLMLGGIGAVSLLVAAIGITNTMVMSITERTREIGIMKSLGCRLKDIRLLFLMEAGFIGLGGGLIGLLVSYLISMVIDVVTAQVPVSNFETFLSAVCGYGTRLSVIPWWLGLFATGFACLVGILSGLVPANKAVKISALEAIRHD